VGMKADTTGRGAHLLSPRAGRGLRGTQVP
jgi:hypothetical protein